MTQVLLLDAAWQPVRLISRRRAVVLLLQAKAELIEAATDRLRAAGTAVDAPLVVRLVRYVHVRGRRRRAIPCSRRAVFIRDRDTCQYCGATPGRAHLTLDHVLPRSRGGVTAWENVVAACEPCNARKANQTPSEAGMRLMTTPVAPKYLALALVDVERHAVWSKYVG